MKKTLALVSFILLFLVSCDNDDTTIPPGSATVEPEVFAAGSADFSKFVAIGNSLTAGFSDGALFIEGQNASFPNMIASSFKAAGGGEFVIPLMADNLGGATFAGNQILGNRFILSFESGFPSPVRKEGMGTTEITTVLSGPFNNMGVPGAKSYHLVAPGYGNLEGVLGGTANPYYARFASSPMATVIGDAVAQSPTFFSVWIGNNDVLGYATSGGLGVVREATEDPATYGGSDITPPLVLENICLFLPRYPTMR